MKKYQLLLISLVAITKAGLLLLLIASFQMNHPTTSKLTSEKQASANLDLPETLPDAQEISVSQPQGRDTIELGQVAWLRDYAAAVQLARKEGKPIFILFQEVPGCLNCQRFGREVMSNPLIVDVIEQEFVPLCIFNNKSGADAATLRKFKEPAWNNPVVRIINPQGQDIVKRMAQFHPQEIVNGIKEALALSNHETPEYFTLLHQQINAQYGQTEEAVFPMYCFWSGELKLGQVEGVYNTTPGFMNGREVVKVAFDKEKISFRELVQKAKSIEAIEGAYVQGEQQRSQAEEVLGKQAVRSRGDFRTDREPKYYMSHTLYKHIPMLPTQRIQVNRAIYQQRDPRAYLSPSQIELYQTIKTKKIRLPDYSLSEDIVDDWEAVTQKVKG